MGVSVVSRVSWARAPMKVWDRHDEQWDAMFIALKVAVAACGRDINVPKSFVDQAGRKLGVWLNTQRWDFRCGRLSHSKMRALEAAGVVWEVHEERWDEMFIALKVAAVGRKRGINVPSTFTDVAGRKLGWWLVNQRVLYRLGRLPPDRVQALEAVGVRWGLLEPWDVVFAALQAAVAACGRDINVSRSFTDAMGRKLGVWLESQRAAYRLGRLHRDRVRALEAAGVRWRTG